MTHVINVMSTVNGQLNTISNWYNNNKSNSLRNLPNVPNFLYVSTDRSIDFHPENKIDKDKDVDIYKAMLCDTGDNFNPAYLCVTTNIADIMVDKVPIYVSKSNDVGPGIAYVINVPEVLFSADCEIEYSAEVLVNLYLTILSHDTNLKYKPEGPILSLSKDCRLKVPTYDLEMMLIALGYANINLINWYGVTNDAAIEQILSTSQFKDYPIPEDIKKGVVETLKRHATNKISSLKDSIANGSIILDALYEVED